MATQTTPHTETQQNADPAQADLETNQAAADSGQGQDASPYENMDGAQTGGTRAFNANAGRSGSRNTESFPAAADGGTDTRTPESEEQGITNHSASEESARQRKVVSERPDATAGVDQTGHSVR
ncbi:hypothetical protein JAO29_15930 [Edaphobacter sp. HDX4]|uniref:hypothetical protein n=1 Tax=Edaphobacter sp. HDX4 TaxID=2794064 RepID=UPI002FE5158A